MLLVCQLRSVRRRIQDPWVAGYRKIDDGTVEFANPRPLSYFPGALAYLFFSSPSQFKKTGSWAEFAKAPSGTGPFQITEFTVNDTAEHDVGISPAPSCALDRLRETPRSSALGRRDRQPRRTRQHCDHSLTSLAGIITELGTSRFAIVGR